MLIYVRGKSNRLCSSETRYATKFFLSKLVSKRLIKTLTLHVVFEERLSVKGCCEYLDTNDRPREFKILLKSSLSKPETLKTLAHELVHLKQFARGEMKDYLLKNATRWNKQTVFHENVDYWDYPWEIEAFGREIGLYAKYIDHKDQCRLTFI